MIGIEINSAASGFAGGEAFISGLDAMVHSVANQMHERFSKSVKNVLIEIGILSGKFERDILAALLGNIADNAWKAPEKLLDRHHAYFQNAFVKLIEDAGLKSHGVSKFCAQGIAGVLLVEFRKRAIEHGLSDDQFADKIHNGIDTGSIDPKGAFGNGGYCRTGSTGIRSCTAFGALGGSGDKFRCLRLQQIAEQFMFGCFGSRGMFKTHIGDYGGN